MQINGKGGRSYIRSRSVIISFTLRAVRHFVLRAPQHDMTARQPPAIAYLKRIPTGSKTFPTLPNCYVYSGFFSKF